MPIVEQRICTGKGSGERNSVPMCIGEQGCTCGTGCSTSTQTRQGDLQSGKPARLISGRQTLMPGKRSEQNKNVSTIRHGTGDVRESLKETKEGCRPLQIMERWGIGHKL